MKNICERLLPTFKRQENKGSEVPQGSILGQMLLLICINNLSENLVSNPKLFADGTSLLCVVTNHSLLAINLNNDLDKISNPDPCKNAQEIIIFETVTRGVL